MRRLFLGLFALSGCTDNQDEAGARELLARVQGMDYRAWDRAPGYETRRDTRAPHGESVDIFVDDTMATALSEPRLYEWPEGSIIVKDGYDGSDLEIIAILEKRETGWFWAEYNADGDPIFSGQPEICVGCHRIGDDYVRAFYFPPGN